MLRIIRSVAAIAAISFSGAAFAASVYTGNGATGFGGPLGQGSLSISEDGSGNVTFTLNNHGGFSGNDVVVYIDSVAGGFVDNSLFGDNTDGGRTAVSATNDGNPSKELISFPTGFAADYALEFENDTFDGLFGLAAGGNNSLNYITGNGPSTTGGPYVVTFPLSDIGLTTGQGFNFVADLISTSAYGSNETIGPAIASDGTTIGNNPGFNGTLTFTGSENFAVPEPASIGLLGLAGLAMIRRRRSV